MPKNTLYVWSGKMMFVPKVIKTIHFLTIWTHMNPFSFSKNWPEFFPPCSNIARANSIVQFSLSIWNTWILAKYELNRLKWHNDKNNRFYCYFFCFNTQIFRKSMFRTLWNRILVLSAFGSFRRKKFQGAVYFFSCCQFLNFMWITCLRHSWSVLFI